METKRTSPGAWVVRAVALAGMLTIVYRFWRGLGAATNLNDGYPWGLWVTVDILAGVALAAGGFVIAGTVHLFGGKKYESLARPAILTAFLGYLLFAFGLIVDLGRPWNLFNIMLFGNHESPLYEIGWCAFLYTIVLFLELLPAVFEKFSWGRVKAFYLKTSPWVVIVLLTVFAAAMTRSTAWTLVIAGILLGWELLMETGVMPRDTQTPILLIMAGVIFSFLHQSSLGTLYLMMATKLDPLWYTPVLPIFFFISAVLAGVSMVALEAIAAEKFLRHPVDLAPITTLVAKMPLALGLYILLKLEDLASRNVAGELFQFTLPAAAWWLEIGLGAILPLFLFLKRDFIKKRGGLALICGLVVLGLLINRTNVSLTGITVPRWEPYYPRWSEWLVTAGILCMGFLAYDWLTVRLPIISVKRAVAA
ncbi:MAG: NrfD/PsrC family molybdoenzyme membrane anchor subunit [Thermodesulfobacteriota bacterium]